MLYIKWNRNGIDYSHPWHIGDALPLLTGRVFTFQADGDELELILDALKPIDDEESEINLSGGDLG